MDSLIDLPAADGSRSIPVESGEWAGWMTSAGDPFNDHAGPFYHRHAEDGSILCAMRVERKHLNGGGGLHGGALMTFADHCLYVFGGALGDARAVTVTLNGEFAGGVSLGALVECRGDVVRSTGSMIFLRGLMASAGQPVMSFSGVLKKKRPAR